MAAALAELSFLPKLRLQINNRKLIEGFYRGWAHRTLQR